ncbi:CBS domain-containing protein [Salibacterium aidingense]|uniref:CBS domain-containing protein n=1 Tax=Salibacterium aidingense TaxID=384933 RepID=UPI003BD26F3F
MAAILKDVMSPNPVSSNATDELTTVSKKMKEEDVGFIPVKEDDKYAGVVTDRDIVVNGLAKGSAENVQASDVMTENIVTGPPDMEVEEAARLMQEHQIKRLLVMEDKEVKGVATLGDLGVENAVETAGNVIHDVSKGNGNN